MARQGSSQQSQPIAVGPAKAARPLRVHSAEGSAMPSIAMPRARTELTAILAGDHTLCLRPRGQRATAPVENAVEAGAEQAEKPSAVDPGVPRDLRRVCEAWPRLSQGVRTAIHAMISASVE